MKRLLWILLALTLTLAGCAPASVPEEDDGRLKIVATVFPAYDFARAAAGDRADVTLLLPPGMESHSYEPTPADILAVQSCDLFIYLGGEADAWVDTILSAVEPTGEVLRMVDCVELLEETHAEGMQTDPGHDHAGHSHGPEEEALLHDGHDHDEHADGADHDGHDHDGHDHDAKDPLGLGSVVGMDEHVWTSPANAAAITREIGRQLAALDAANADAYQADAEAYALRLEELDGKFEAFFDSRPHRTIVFGDRFPLLYFAERYGLDYYAAFPGCGTQTEPSAATIAFLTEKVRSEDLPTVWYIEFSNHLVADSIAEATGRQTAQFHTCHNVTRAELDAGATYLSLMEGNLETLMACF